MSGTVKERFKICGIGPGHLNSAFLLHRYIRTFASLCCYLSMSSPLVKEYHFNVPIQEVWEALTDRDKMKIWYFPQLQQFKPVVEFKFQFDDPGAEYQKEWIVTKLIPGKTFAHSWSYEGYPGTSEVIFDLSADGTSTILTVTQTGIESFPDHSHFKSECFERGWDSLLGQNLKRLVEDGNGY